MAFVVANGTRQDCFVIDRKARHWRCVMRERKRVTRGRRKTTCLAGVNNLEWIGQRVRECRRGSVFVLRLLWDLY